jgi:hypothetical protein
MPDGDHFHQKLPNRYKSVYKQICAENRAASYEELAAEVLRGLRHDFTRYGNKPLEMIRQAVKQMEQLPSGPLFKSTIEWGQESQKLDKITQQLGGGYISNLAIEACKMQLQEIRGKGSPQDLLSTTIEKYFQNVYEARFEGRLPLAEHYNNVSQLYVDKEVAAMRPHILNGLRDFAEQVAKKGRIGKLRLSPVLRIKPKIDLETNLLGGVA